MTDGTMISSTNQVELSDAARSRAKRDHVTWIIWEKDGVFHADQETTASLILAIEASESRTFYGLEASTGNGFIIKPETALAMLNNFKLNH